MKDLVIIGGGPGGYVGAIRAAQLGMQVALIEKEELGGTCLHRGCMPTKAYYQNASVLRLLQHSAAYNIATGPVTFDMAGALARKEKIVGDLVRGIAALLKANGVEVIRGVGRIVAPDKVCVNDQVIEARNILIASGSVSHRPPIPGVGLPGVVTSDEILELDHVPATLTVVGGGVIGLEFACIFKSFGSKVTVMEYLPEVLGVADREISKRMKVFLKRQDIDVHTSTRVISISENGGTLSVAADAGKGEFSVTADIVLVATGRKASLEGLGLDSAGISVNSKGYIEVDANFATSTPSIYAIGDVIGGRMLAHVASEEGRVAVERMAGHQAEVAYHAVPSVVFTFPEMATVGLTEEEAVAAGMDIKIGKFQFAANSKAVAMGETDGLVKVIADAGGVIVGVHILGPHAADLIQAASVIVKNRLRTSEVSTAIHPHPTLGEALLEAVMDVDRRAIHLAPRK